MEITRKDVAFFSYWTYKTMEIVTVEKCFFIWLLDLYDYGLGTSYFRIKIIRSLYIVYCVLFWYE